MSQLKITLLCISMFIVLFLVFAALYDLVRCLAEPEAYYYSITSNHFQGSKLWYWDLFKPNLIVLLFCFPKFYIIKKYAEVGERSSIWNSAFYFAFVVLITVATLSVVEVFDTSDVIIVPNE